MAQLNFTLNLEDLQAIIQKSGADDLSKQLLTTIFNQLMENQRDEYIQVDEYSRNQNRVSQRNGYYQRSYITHIGTLELEVPRTRMDYLQRMSSNAINDMNKPSSRAC
jgi:transposase-like protein